MNKALKITAEYFVVLSCSLIAALLLLLALNPVAEWYIANHPQILMTPADRANHQTRAIRESLIPEDKITLWFDLASKEDMARMWEERYSAGAVFESYVHFRSRTLVGEFYGATEHGYRLVRNNGPWPPDTSHFNIFFFGGSTSFGVGPYWATVASYLQEYLRASGVFDRSVDVYNFGGSGYHSTQEQILFHRLISEGFRPNMVVFLDGLNDFCFADGQPSSWQSLARFFNETNVNYQRRMRGYGVATEWTKAREFVLSMPAIRLLEAGLTGLTAQPPPEYAGPERAEKEDIPENPVLNRVIDRYLMNTEQVAAVSSRLGIVPVFVWQPIPTYEYDARQHLFYPSRLGCHVNSKYGYPLMRKVFDSGRLDKNFIWAAGLQESLAQNLYVDSFHYTAPFSRRIAEFIGESILSRGLANAATWRTPRAAAQ
jgi:hypothetical protein